MLQRTDKFVHDVTALDVFKVGSATDFEELLHHMLQGLIGLLGLRSSFLREEFIHGILERTFAIRLFRLGHGNASGLCFQLQLLFRKCFDRISGLFTHVLPATLVAFVPLNLEVTAGCFDLGTFVFGSLSE